MARSRAFAANGTERLLLNMDDQSKSVAIAFDAIQDQNVRAWKKGLRMARGRCHRSPTLKHLGPNVFYAELHQERGRA